MTSVVLAVLLAACVAVHGMPQFESNFVEKMGIAEAETHTYRLSYTPYEDAFKQFQRDHDKQYKNDFEESQRFAVFMSNVKYMEEHNLKFHKGQVSYYLGVNQFSDLTHDEYLRVNRLGKYASATKPTAFPTCFASNTIEDPAPETMDWRKKGAVTHVKNQGNCGSCWTFSATGSIEGQNFIHYGKLLSFSEQQILDCCHDQFCSGCSGGIMDEAFKYINQTGGLELESDYPYQAEDEPCRFKKSKVHVQVFGCTDVKTGDENKLKSAVGTKGPVSVAIDAGHFSFQSYAGGVYIEPACHSEEDKLDHGVLTVGYGTDNGSDYWLVKNSWGTGWGMHGYIMMARNKQNQCGIATAASYPRVHKP